MSPDGRPFVSVIVPAFNDLAGLERCLAALAAQTYDEDWHEVIVVDNGSRQDPGSVVGRFPRARLLREERPGSYAARNRGIVDARGEVLAFTDSDCVPARDWLAKGVEALLRAPECGFVAGRVTLEFRDPARPTPAELYDFLVMSFHQDRNITERHFGATANLFVFKRVFETVGTFDAGLMSGGDLEWGRRVFDRGLPQLYAGDAAVAHPARHTLADTFRQARRLTGGTYGLKARSGASPARRALDLARALTPAVGFYLRLLRDGRLERFGQRVTVVWVALRVKYVVAWELIRLMAGGEPRRG
jgi:glycosyltransferase involved in cell wall biosynthesis